MSVYSCMYSKVSSDWWQSYIKVVLLVIKLFKMVGFLPHRPYLICIQHWKWGLFKALFIYLLFIVIYSPNLDIHILSLSIMISYNHCQINFYSAQSTGDVKYTDCIFAAGLDAPTLNECPGYDTKLLDSGASVFWEMWSIPSLPLLPGPLWLKVVVPVRVPSMFYHLTVYKRLMLNC